MAEQTMASDKDKGGASTCTESPPAPAAFAKPLDQTRHVRRAPGFAIALYCLLALSATVALLGRNSHFLPELARIAAPIAFAAFFVLFAIYRFALVRARRYSPGKAFVQLGIGSLFLLMLAPGVMHQRAEAVPLEPVARMLHHADPSVRALACDAFLLLPASEANAALPELQALISDPHPGVRARARRAIERHVQPNSATGSPAADLPLPAPPAGQEQP